MNPGLRADAPEGASDGIDDGVNPGMGEPWQPSVLVVEDDPASLRMLMDALESQGYRVLLAPSAEAALQRLAYATPDALLLDCMLPGMSGFALCQQLKRDPATQAVPVIFMTGLGETEDIVRGFDSGGVDYVVKPVRIHEVLARLATHTRNARSARMAHQAIDVAGMGIVCMDGAGRIVWQSPQGHAWLQQAVAAGRLLPQALADLQPPATLELVWGDEQVLHMHTVAAPGEGERMLLMRLHARQADGSSRVRDAALTPRETEVLSWVAKGKTNRDIADILALSPRTVNKHLEHIFEKLGVETRAAAAALASREAL